jgi:hypothetical protein
MEPEVTLFVDLVPNTAWYSNLRSELFPHEWELVKKRTFSEARHRCQVCGGRGPAHPVECHERFTYDEAAQVLSLIRTVALCPACHEVTHFGLASVRGRIAQAQAHLMTVNGWNLDQTNQHVDAAMQLWKTRGLTEWVLDATWLLDFVPLSEETTRKIKDHADGLATRNVKVGQRRIIGERARAAGLF